MILIRFKEIHVRYLNRCRVYYVCCEHLKYRMMNSPFHIEGADPSCEVKDFTFRAVSGCKRGQLMTLFPVSGKIIAILSIKY